MVLNDLRVAIWTQQDIDTLKAAIASGILQVQYAGPPARSVTYQSLGEMRKLLSEMLTDVAGDTAAPRFRRAAFRKGFDRVGRCGWRRNE